MDTQMPELQAVVERLEKVERQNRRLKVAGAVALALMRILIYSVIALVLAASARASGSVPVRLHSLRDECVKIRVVAESPRISREQALENVEIMFRASGSFVFPRMSGGGGGVGEESFWIRMTFWLEERKRGFGFVSRVSRSLPHEWAATVLVDWRGIDLFRVSPGIVKRQLDAERRQREVAKQRADRLGWIVVPKKGGTVGDALQTVADLLAMEVAVMPMLTEPYEPNWEAVLELPLAATDVQRRDGLSVQALIDHVAGRLKAVAEIESDCLLFNDKEAAEERRREREALDGNEQVPDLLEPGIEERDDTDEERAPSQDEEDAPVVTPE